MAVTYPTVIYSEDSTIDITPRLIRGKMGDGNQFVAVDGINALDTEGSLVHPYLDPTTASTLRTFLQTNIGSVCTIKNLMQDHTGSTTMNVIITGWSEKSYADNFSFDVKYVKVNNA